VLLVTEAERLLSVSRQGVGGQLHLNLQVGADVEQQAKDGFPGLGSTPAKFVGAVFTAHSADCHHLLLAVDLGPTLFAIILSEFDLVILRFTEELFAQIHESFHTRPGQFIE
jgi:hypothetical protein